MGVGDGRQGSQKVSERMALVVVGRWRKSWRREIIQRETRRNGWRVFYEGVRNFVSVLLHPMAHSIWISVCYHKLK